MNVDSPLLSKEPEPALSAALHVERELREAIISLDLQPGSRLSEQEIADRLNVSRQPVREALIALGRAHLVEARAKRGTIVVKISARKMTEARFVREAIETAVVRRACESFDPWMRSTIDESLVLQRAACASGDYTAFRKQDEQFHLAIANGAGCGLAWSVIADLKAHIDRVCNLQLRKADSMPGLIAQHERIVAAIDQRDPEAAAAAMSLHLNGILIDLPKIAASHPDLFE
ncbi:GntR family transcriptional regulator [Paracoccus sp. CPCC 101403]|uniref:GntR family transcriptional regulator n=2 Tax=Paracoccus broussonetiae TaxID=3075834 RepID=A0ABU3E9C1_9RHOB|nr:GntR family transcriptional regulator [Paracoccus sp. CPCC 101403]MDT1060822.1 GntR family transcriptional regulator [Paracoccus sp. CPCC 101403]